MKHFFFSVALLAIATPAIAEVPSDPALFSKDQYDQYCRFKNFSADEKTLKKYKTADRAKKAFARAERMKTSVLDQIVSVGDGAGGCEGFKALWEARLKKELAAIAGVGDVVKLFDEGAFAGRIDWSEVNASNSAHVVVWVSWKFKDLRFIEEEVALVGAAVAKAIPATGTLSVWAHMGAKKKMVFEAKTYGSNLAFIQPNDAGTFGKTRYWRFFENIRFHKVLRRALKPGEALLTAAKKTPEAGSTN